MCEDICENYEHMIDSLFRKNSVSPEGCSGWRGGQRSVRTEVGLQLDYLRIRSKVMTQHLGKHKPFKAFLLEKYINRGRQDTEKLREGSGELNGLKRLGRIPGQQGISRGF